MNAAVQFVKARLLLFVVIGLGAATALPVAPALWRAAQAGQFQPHAPDWPLFFQQPLAVQIHVVTAIAALAIGTAVWLLPKGRGPHKALGWSWVVLMMITALASLFITGLNGGFYSLIHLLSGWVIVALPMAIYAIRRRNVRAHRRHMAAVFVAGLVVAGAFTFIPGRFMFQLFFG